MPPFHAALLEIFNDVGLWPRFVQWQRELAELLPKQPDSDVVLWDFSGYNAYTTEAVPDRPRDLTLRTRWYLEFTHFKPALGERMIASMLSPESRISASS